MSSTKSAKKALSSSGANKAFVFNDLHLMKSRFGFNEILLNRALEVIVEREPQYVIIPGDIFHSKDATYETVKRQFGNFLRSLCSYHFIVRIILGPGNHDWCIEHTLHALEDFEDKIKYPKVTVVSSALMITEDVGFMAYARTAERYRENLANLNLDKIKVLFGHFALNNFELGTGYEEVDLWCETGIFSDMTNLKKVYSGHWHKYQKKTVNGVDFTYLGSPATVDRGESNQEKYFGIFDFDTYEMELVETGFTMHKSTTVDVGDPLPEVPVGEYQMGVEHVVYLRGTPEQLAGFKDPVGYRGVIIPQVIQADSKRETIDAYSGSVEIVGSYMKKKENDIRERLQVRFEGKLNDAQIDEVIEKWGTFGRRIAMDTGS